MTALRTPHALCETCRSGEPCGYCHVPQNRPCVTTEPGIHLLRVAHGHRDGLVTDAEFASLIPDVFTAGTVVLDIGGVL